MIRPENRNILWATILVDELARAGVRHAVICPGSRSTPLAVAFSRDDRFKIHTIIDERAAAFFALGIGKAAGIPAVVVCTSGTAAANFFPAIIEASMSNVPMIVMTADRPHELRDSGANQTIDQVKLYGGYVRWFVDVAPPHANPEDKTLRYLRTTVDRAVAYSQGSNGGPVHLNVPFEKPLEPVIVEGDVPDRVWEGSGAQGRAADQYGEFHAFTEIVKGWQQVDTNEVPALYNLMQEPKERTLLICGADVEEGLAEVLGAFSELTGYPILADGHSTLRLDTSANGHVISGYETFLRGEFAAQARPQRIIRFGRLPVSGALLSYLERQHDAEHILITTGSWADSEHLVTAVIHADPLGEINMLNLMLDANQPDRALDFTWLSLFADADKVTWDAVSEILSDEESEANILPELINLLSEDEYTSLVIANSNPIRHLDQFVKPQTKAIRGFANRGVSGIDGTVASALGIAEESHTPTVLIIGDTALYHDLNSLHLIRRLNIPLIIVCINNDGGGIFHRLPIAQHEPPFRDLFVMPHGLTFEHAAQMFDIPYTLAQMGEDFRTAFKAALNAGGPALIEVPSDAAKFEQQRKQLIDTVAQRIKESGILEKFKASQEKH